MVKIRRAMYKDIPGIMRFMDEHWKPGNILSKDREFFEWQFVYDGKVNMFIGVDEETDKIYGIMGVIVYNQGPNPDISGCTWQVIKSSNPLLGVDIQKYSRVQMHIRYGCAAGLSDKSVRLNELLGEKIIAMDHYYRLADKEDYMIAKIAQKIIPDVEDTGYRLESLYSVDEMKQIISEEELAGQILSKDYFYIQRRYFEHPIYYYDMWKILDEKGNSRAVLVTRDETAGDQKICKIVDYYGKSEFLGCITSALDDLIKERNYEFIDIYSFGVPTELYERAGFVRCDENSKNIIPNYFHPFVQENISLRMIEYRGVPGLRMFRGDGDQDRPC